MKKLYFSFKKAAFLLLATPLLTLSSEVVGQNINDGLKLHYNFESASGSTVSDVSGNGYNGTLYGATVGITNGKPSLILGPSGADYLDMGASTGNLIGSLNDFSLSTYIWVNETNTNLSSNGNFICVFANSENSGTDRNGVIFLQAKRSRYAITSTYWNAEQFAQTGADVVKGKWVHLTYTQAGTIGKFYVDGELKSTNENITLKPSDIGATPYNFIGKPTYSGDLFLQDAQISDFRIYNRAISLEEVLTLNNYPADLIEAYSTLSLGDLTALTGNITLPTTIGTANVPVEWSSSLTSVITNDGIVTRPDQYDATVKLTATLTLTSGDVTYTLKKEFTAKVLAYTEASEIIAQWDFSSDLISIENGATKVKDATESQFVATIMNDAKIRTIGETDQFNVLDLGNGTGYLDLGTEIGKAIYSLNDYAISAYFYIDENYASLTSNGNFLWTFSNTDNAPVDQNGYIIGRLNGQTVEITPNYYATGNQAVSVGQAAAKGSWHHFCYSQEGNVGTIFVDGVEVKSGTITNKPSISLVKEGRTGTLYNWIGRANYPSDAYLRQTLVYKFELYNVPLTSATLMFGDGIMVTETLDRLNAAYAENNDYKSAALLSEMESLTLGDLSAVINDIVLPTQGTVDPTISISWKSSCEEVISSTGTVTRPDYFDFPLTLTATLSKGAQSVTKQFPAKVLVKEGTQFTGDLVLKHDFSTVNERTVTDKAEKQFAATLMNEATVRTIGTAESGTFNVLDLGNGTGYLDLGAEVGKVMYHLEDYTLSAYYRIDSEYTELGNNGNFIWTFSNTADAMANPIGYIIGSLKNQSNSITAGFYTAESGNQAVGFGTEALKGEWHHIAYVQNGTNGIVYIDGMPMANAEISNLPKTVLPKSGLIGTPYNWVGRSCYTGDVYLRNTLVADFRLYKKALTDEEIQTTVLNVGNTMGLLEAAYEANPNIPSGLINITNSPYSIGVENDGIRIIGLKGSEKVAVFDISGREVKHSNAAEIATGKGIWIVKIDNYVSKVIVK